IQTAVSKFVAEYEAKGDRDSAGRHASAGLVLMMLAGTLGVALTLALAWQVPNLFHTMPASLYHDVRTSVVLVGFRFRSVWFALCIPRFFWDFSGIGFP